MFRNRYFLPACFPNPQNLCLILILIDSRRGFRHIDFANYGLELNHPMKWRRRGCVCIAMTFRSFQNRCMSYLSASGKMAPSAVCFSAVQHLLSRNGNVYRELMLVVVFVSCFVHKSFLCPTFALRSSNLHTDFDPELGFSQILEIV